MALGMMAVVWTASAAQARSLAGVQKSESARVSAPRAAAKKRERAFRTVVDEAGRKVKVPLHVRRVVSLAPNLTDILYALGVGGKVVGITNFTKLPQSKARKPSVGDPTNPSLEEIVARKPDLVLASETINRLNTVESLERLKISVYVTYTRSVEGMLGTIKRIAKLVGTKQAGEKLAGRLQTRLDAVRAKLAGRKPKRVLFVLWENPLITTGRDTFVADALRWAGARSVVNLREHWPEVSLEEIVYLQPEYIIFPSTHGGTAEDIRKALLQRPGWRELKAVQQGQVLVVSGAINRPSPKLVSAIEQLARMLHPGAFEKDSTPKKEGSRAEESAPRPANEHTGNAGAPKAGGTGWRE